MSVKSWVDVTFPVFLLLLDSENKVIYKNMDIFYNRQIHYNQYQNGHYILFWVNLVNQIRGLFKMYCFFFHFGTCCFEKLKLPVLVGPLSAIQPYNLSWTFNFPWSLFYIMKLAFWSPGGKYFTSGVVCSQHMAPGNIQHAQTQTSQDTNSHLGRVEPRRFICCAQRNSRQASEGFEPRTSRSAGECTTTGPTRVFLVFNRQPFFRTNHA